MTDIKRCSNCHYWDPKKIGMKNKGFDVLHCWCFKHYKHTDSTDTCDAHSTTQIITGEGK